MVVIGSMQDHGCVPMTELDRQIANASRMRPLRTSRLLVLLIAATIADRPSAAGYGRKPHGGGIEASVIVPSMLLPGGVPLGGLSDLARDPALDDESRGMWAVTDRGPNGIVEADGGTRRTLLHPDFSPCLVLLSLPIGNSEIGIHQVLPLRGRSGRPCSGRANGVGQDAPIRDSVGKSPLPPDPLGVDPEGVVRLADGTFWIAEEYRPSLLKVAGDGTVLARFIPEGESLPGADTDVRAVLPRHYACRRDNRGFEALAATPDGGRLWALLQSPLDNPGPKAAVKTGNVRLLGFDPMAGRAVAEHVYRLGDPRDANYLRRGCPPADGKLCAMASLGAELLLVLEQDDDGLARLYAVDLAKATDTLRWHASDDDARILEQVRDLEAAGIAPVGKELIADLTPLRAAMAAEADAASDARHGPLKLEGLAVLDERHVVVVNDNDFGVQNKGGPARRTCLWTIRLDRPLPGSIR